MKFIVKRSCLSRPFSRSTIFAMLGLGATFVVIAATKNPSVEITLGQKNPALQTDFPRADLNGDGVVDYVDLGIVSVAVGYGNCTGCPEDLNKLLQLTRWVLKGQ